jgi:hypothetical protein
VLTFADASKQGRAAPGHNFLINGDFPIWQRGTSFTASTSLGQTVYTADRWFTSQLAVQSSLTVSQQLTGLNGGTGYFGCRAQKGSGSAGASVNILGQIIEFANCRNLWGDTVTLSFKAKCGANYSSAGSSLAVNMYTGTIADQSSAAMVNNTLTGQANILNNSVALTANYQQFSFSGVQILPGIGVLGVTFASTTVGTAGAADWFEITDVKIERGPVVTPFDRSDFAASFQQCLRYYEVCLLSAGAAYPSGGVGALALSPVTFKAPKRNNAYTVSLQALVTNVNVSSAVVVNPTMAGMTYQVQQGAAAGGYYAVGVGFFDNEL